MSDPTRPPEPGFQLHQERVEEIRDLLVRLVIGPADEAAARELLTECLPALTHLLNERDALVHANHEAGEELARWLGAI